jgi:spore maturation protein B
MPELAAISRWVLPALILGVPWFAHLRGVKVYEKFVEGAGQAFDITIRILPYLVAMLVAVAVFRASGALELIARMLGPVLGRVGFPAGLLPLVVIRPLSGNGALAALVEVLKLYGPDSFAGRLGSTLVGSTETTFYVIAVYFGSAGVKRFRYAVLVGLAADLAGTLAAFILCRIAFPLT